MPTSSNDSSSAAHGTKRDTTPRAARTPEHRSDLDAADPAETPVQRRTRLTIQGAAVAVWARDYTATLGDIAKRAQVSRSTLHRYFPDRDALVEAAAIDAAKRLESASGHSMPSTVPPIERMEAWLRASVRLSDAVLFLYADPERFAQFPSVWEGTSESVTENTVAEAQRSRQIDPELPASWVVHHFYAIIYIAAEMVTDGAMSVEEAADLATRTWRHGVGAR